MFYFQMLKSFQVKVEVDPQYHSKIIGRRGVVVNKIRDQFDVNIQFPGRDDPPDSNTITITGYEDKANAAKEEILKIVREYVSFYLELVFCSYLLISTTFDIYLLEIYQIIWKIMYISDCK